MVLGVLIRFGDDPRGSIGNALEKKRLLVFRGNISELDGDVPDRELFPEERGCSENL